MTKLSYAVLKRRKRGREGVQALFRIRTALSYSHLHFGPRRANVIWRTLHDFRWFIETEPDVARMPPPSWDTEDDRLAAVFLTELAQEVELREAYARNLK